MFEVASRYGEIERLILFSKLIIVLSTLEFNIKEKYILRGKNEGHNYLECFLDGICTWKISHRTYR
jgi:hypothetical protein